MKITSLKLNDFKFYTEQYFNTNNKNILLYGENGSGKSSLYWALYAFYKSVYSSNPAKYIKQLDRTQVNNLTNHNTNQDAKITVTFDNTANIEIDKNFTPSSLTQSLDSFKTIHFLNHEKLFTLFLNSNSSAFNFYDVIQKEFFYKFDLFNDVEVELEKTKQSLQINQDTLLLNTSLDKALTTLINLVNNVLTITFQEQLEIKFIIDDKFLAEGDNAEKIWFLANPKILVTINNHNDFNLRINEARIKLVSLLIYLVLIKMNDESAQGSTSLLKLLVLDDILLSLDMAQRSKILEYIFENFSLKYQLFIFTHDIFYDLVKRKIMHMQDKTQFDQTTWEDVFVFSKQNPNNYFEPMIYRANDDYLKKAKKFLDKNNLLECGNNLRKEMEKNIQQMLIEFEIGKRGELYNLIEVFTKLQNKNLYKNSHQLLDEIHAILDNSAIDDAEKIERSKQLIEFHIRVNLTGLNKLLKDFQWHRQIVGNASSHAQLLQNYIPEFQSAIDDVEQLKLLL